MENKKISLRAIKDRFNSGYFTGQNALDVAELLRLVTKKTKEISKLKNEKQILQSATPHS